jgi:hypothetical protein
MIASAFGPGPGHASVTESGDFPGRPGTRTLNDPAAASAAAAAAASHRSSGTRAAAQAENLNVPDRTDPSHTRPGVQGVANLPVNAQQEGGNKGRNEHERAGEHMAEKFNVVLNGH